MSGRETLAEIIDRHEYDVNLSTGLPRPACACGWIADGVWGSTFVHSEHVADAIRPLLAEAWDEGYRLDWTGGVRWANPYREGGVS